MKLTFHRGDNFGDKLNPLIFEHYLPDFFDDDTSIRFLGIGTILGLKKFAEGKKIVFSSGASNTMRSTYGEVPELDDSYDIYCVRGPLTAELLNLPSEKAITDGPHFCMIFIMNPMKKFMNIHICHM